VIDAIREVMMLVPAMAFAWCVVSLPMRTPPATQGVHMARAGTTSSTSTPLAPDNGRPREAPQGRSERTVLRGPIAPNVIAFARTLVNLPMGAEQVAEIDGQRYVFVLERHYHPPGFVGAPNGWHKGVTAYGLQ
jgi:hypothetical protein